MENLGFRAIYTLRIIIYLRNLRNLRNHFEFKFLRAGQKYDHIIVDFTEIFKLNSKILRVFICIIVIQINCKFSWVQMVNTTAVFPFYNFEQIFSVYDCCVELHMKNNFLFFHGIAILRANRPKISYNNYVRVVPLLEMRFK
ncbi:hypothetical protein BpHYR1_022367 [Brachionus plicatilis]|uniref:Uncharacterized protein n=1 Tax=Brachionus plicatilis TaxID=10195 RepID=A0A3M7PQB4_BRAPC|nr:hypothetical protein BpHYR1_022367 [Brachionus plicatilis]